MKSNDNERKKSIFHKRNIATRASIITINSNNDLDTTTSTTADKGVESGQVTVVIAERVMPSVESESAN
jgi:hypothetical protein